MKTRVTRFQNRMRPCLAVILLAFSAIPYGHAQSALPTSPALSALIQQADQMYARRVNTTMQYFFDNVPVNAAIMMGLAMHSQKRIADLNPSYLSHYEALRREAHDFLGGLVQAHNFRNPFDGQPLTRDHLVMVFDSNASGEQNPWAVRNGLPDPALMTPPSLLGMVSAQSLGRLHLRDEDNAIRLLDEEAPPGPLGGNWGQPIPPPPQPKPDPVKQPLSPGAILGRWQLAKKGNCYDYDEDSPRHGIYLEFHRGSGRDLYVGRSTANPPDTFRVRTEQQTDAFTIKYTAVWENPHGQMRDLVHGKTFAITVRRGNKNGILLCRGDCFVVVSQGFIKVSQ